MILIASIAQLIREDEPDHFPDHILRKTAADWLHLTLARQRVFPIMMR